MRRRKRDLAARVNGELALEFTAQGLTSYSGLELLGRFLRDIGFSERLRRHLKSCDPGGDYGSVSMVRLLLAMLVVGARRLRHVRYLTDDPVVARFAGLKSLPTDRSLSRWLSKCQASVRAALFSLNVELVADIVRPLKLKRLTLDLDGTVLSTGLSVERAFRGFNPHHRKVPSYYPITAYLAQTGHVLGVKNRSGNVHDGKAGMPFLRDLFRQAQEAFPDTLFEVRLDGAFFRQDIVTWLEHRAEYAIRVPFYRWIGLKDLIRERCRWKRVAEGIDGFDTQVLLGPWSQKLRVAIYRKRVFHRTAKNYQLDLFDPDDGIWEYSAITTNKPLGLEALWHFMAGRGAHEKAIGELKSGYAFDAIPTQNYAANSTWQILSALAHNVVTSFQLATGAPRRPRTRKRTAHYVLKSIHTLRYEIFHRAGILRRPQGRLTLTLSANLPTRDLFRKLVGKLVQAV